MADGEKRIVELTETQTFGNGDYLPLDNISNSETKKIEAKKLGITYTMTDTENGFSFDGSNGYHYEKVIPKDAEMSYDDYDDLTEEEKMDGSNRFIPDYPDEVKEPEIWTRVGRTPLETDAKTISPAINELKGRIDGNDDDITEIKSNLTHLEDYSTDEVVCGKWVDGKTLYKKTLTITITSTTQRGEIDIASLNVDKVVSIEGIAFQGNYARPIISSYRAHTQTTSAPSELSDVYFDKGSSRKTLVVIASGVNLGDCYITIKYTKE